MLEKNDDLKRETMAVLKETQTVFLGTVEGDRPRVRPVTLIRLDEGLYITTGTDDAKVNQIKANPNVEVAWYFGEESKNGSIRLAGSAEIIQDRATKEKVANTIEWFNVFFKSPDDPGFTLLEVHPQSAEYMRPGEMQIQRFRL